MKKPLFNLVLWPLYLILFSLGGEWVIVKYLYESPRELNCQLAVIFWMAMVISLWLVIPLLMKGDAHVSPEQNG